MNADVVQHFTNGPALAYADVVRRHEPADGVLRIAEERQRDRAFGRCEQRKHLSSDFSRQLLQEHCSIVGRHVVQQCRHVFLGHCLQQSLLLLARQILKDRCSVLAGKDTKDDDLLLQTKLRESDCQVVRMTIANQIPQPCIVARLYCSGQFVRRPGHVTNDAKYFFALRTGELLFHLCKCRPHDVVMMNFRSDRLDGIEPDAMNQIQVAGR